MESELFDRIEKRDAGLVVIGATAGLCNCAGITLTKAVRVRDGLRGGVVLGNFLRGICSLRHCAPTSATSPPVPRSQQEIGAAVGASPSPSRGQTIALLFPAASA